MGFENEDLQPISITQMENTFSELVLGLTFPNPTEVRLEKVKYRAVMYLDFRVGPELLLFGKYG